MFEKLKHTFALSDQGAKDMIKAFLACILHNLSLVVPVALLYSLVNDLLDGGVPEGKGALYIAGLDIALGLIMLTYYVQYNATFFATYVESGVRRVTLAEKLRKIPLSFFGKRDLSDLTTVLMADCASLESGLSHWVPELVGSVASTLLIAVGIFLFNWKMALASLLGTACLFRDPVSDLRSQGQVGAESEPGADLLCRRDTGVPGIRQGSESKQCGKQIPGGIGRQDQDGRKTDRGQ